MKPIGLYNAQQGNAALNALYQSLKPQLIAGHRFDIIVRPEKRSDKENRLLHALLGHIADTTEWAGSLHDIEVWKRLLMAAWCRANGEAIKILPALDGQGVDIVFRRSSDLDKQECASLIEYILAWGADNGIQFPADPRWTD